MVVNKQFGKVQKIKNKAELACMSIVLKIVSKMISLKEMSWRPLYHKGTYSYLIRKPKHPAGKRTVKSFR